MRQYRLGLTGSIGMGKSTTAAIFARAGVPIWDADAAVHRLYAAGGRGAKALAADFPEAVSDNGVSRETLKRMLAADPQKFALLEKLVHPLVAQDRLEFLARNGAGLVVLDIPLLYEKHYEDQCDAVLLVTAPADLQKARVMARGTMSEADFALILSRQMPDREKRARADHLVETLSIATVEAYVAALIAHLSAKIVTAEGI